MPVLPDPVIATIEDQFMKDIGCTPKVALTKEKFDDIRAEINQDNYEKLKHLQTRVTPKSQALFKKDWAAKAEPDGIQPEPPEEDVLEEALRITSGDRQSQYGPPEQDFTRTAAMWSGLFGHKLKEPFEARDVAMAMICLKLSRETHQRKRDNSVDVAGYARLLHIINQANP
jgi:hypothetical protein